MPDSERRGSSQRRISTTSVSIAITLTLASVGVLSFVFHCTATAIKSRLDPDVFKLTYQFLLIVVLGGAVSLLYKEFSTERDQAQERRVLLRQMHSELLSAFNTAKKIRRTLRARVGYSPDNETTSTLIVHADDYREQIDLLMDAQLTFEVYSKRAKDRQLFFASGEELGRERENRAIPQRDNQRIRGQPQEFFRDTPEQKTSWIYRSLWIL